MPHSSFSMPGELRERRAELDLPHAREVGARGVGMLGHRLRLVRPDLERGGALRAASASAAPGSKISWSTSVAPAASVAPSAIAMPAVQKNGYAV